MMVADLTLVHSKAENRKPVWPPQKNVKINFQVIFLKTWLSSRRNEL
jgi:hypothetical protein